MSNNRPESTLFPPFSWSNKRIFLTGGTGKLGRIMVDTLLNQGAEVIATYHSARNIHELPVHPRLRWLQLNLLSDLSRKECIERVSELPINIIIHNARSLMSLAVDQEGWANADNMQNELMMAVSGPYDLCRGMIKNHPLEQILFINSMYGLVTPQLNLYADIASAPGAQYGTAKAAQLHLVKELAVRLATKKIRVNALVLGGVKGHAPQQFVAQYQNQCPSGAMLEDEEVKNSLIMALQHNIPSLTGHHFVVDGGWTLW